MTTISAETILRSRSAVSGDILTTLLLRYPRFSHPEQHGNFTGFRQLRHML